ncbi:MAG: hypothetical protein A2138_17880 [Deltaproteobacteria bacterium RBG_16_71_12]|nr:MAG: hypothetical protein A2138_17880 [Deltaproteobacteria bacterium RBG_16_71_12]
MCRTWLAVLPLAVLVAAGCLAPQPVLADLGVVVDAVGGVALDDQAPLAAIRRAITRPAQHAAAPLAAR